MIFRKSSVKSSANIVTRDKEWVRLLRSNGFFIERVPLTDHNTKYCLEDFGKVLVEKWSLMLDDKNYGYVFYFNDGRADFRLVREQNDGTTAEIKFKKPDNFSPKQQVDLAEKAIWGFYLESRFAKMTIKE